MGGWRDYSTQSLINQSSEHSIATMCQSWGRGESQKKYNWWPNFSAGEKQLNLGEEWTEGEPSLA